LDAAACSREEGGLFLITTKAVALEAIQAPIKATKANFLIDMIPFATLVHVKDRKALLLQLQIFAKE
jgi:hypothetical protein